MPGTSARPLGQGALVFGRVRRIADDYQRHTEGAQAARLRVGLEDYVGVVLRFEAADVQQVVAGSKAHWRRGSRPGGTRAGSEPYGM